MKKTITTISICLVVLCAIFWSVATEAESAASPTPTPTAAVSSNATHIGGLSSTRSAGSSGATLGEKNALRAAELYLEVMPFSAAGLKDQLEYDGYSETECDYAVSHCGADWHEQASLCAARYLDLMPFSRNGLIEQLEYEGFTYKQAVYGAERNGY